MYAKGPKGVVLVVDASAGGFRVSEELWVGPRARRYLISGSFEHAIVARIPAKELRAQVRQRGSLPRPARSRRNSWGGTSTPFFVTPVTAIDPARTGSQAPGHPMFPVGSTWGSTGGDCEDDTPYQDAIVEELVRRMGAEWIEAELNAVSQGWCTDDG
ncbi:MAG: hypothetical protein JW751_19025 [Polyangiaceae bacterium]|nr:hypothetical protein [Polyangiaceae bacterium]